MIEEGWGEGGKGGEGEEGWKREKGGVRKMKEK